MRTKLVTTATIVFVLATSLAAFGALPPGGTFTDDDGNTHESDIEAIAAEDVTKGCNPPFEDRYCPDATVDRGAIAAFLRRAMDLPSTSIDYFSDDDGSIFEGDINAIAEAGITKGCNPPTNTLYCPNDVLRRGVMAALLRRAMDLPSTSIDYFSDDDGSIFEGDINAIAEAGITKGCNPPANTLFCPNDTVKRDTMASFLTRAFRFTPETPDPRPPLDWELVLGGLTSPIQVLAPPGENRLLIAQQGGRILTFENGSTGTFLDIEDDVLFSGERGLLSMAVHPNYPTDRRLFVWYSGKDSDTYLVEFDIAADLQAASSPRVVLEIDQPATNHNGGFVAFGEDGFLYLSTGDGGGGNDTYKTARNLNSLLGKMLRLDVDGSHPYEVPSDNPYVGKAGRDEVWASGLRNPFRWSFDNGHMFIGDVGQAAREEINFVEVDPIGYDFGWSRYEGTLCNPNDHDPSCSVSGLKFPIHEYGRSTGRSVTGGIVYRGPTVTSLSGYYLWADVYSGTVQGFRVDDGQDVEHLNLTSDLGLGGIVSFAEDGDGELLVVSLFSGAVYRLTGG